MWTLDKLMASLSTPIGGVAWIAILLNFVYHLYVIVLSSSNSLFGKTIDGNSKYYGLCSNSTSRMKRVTIALSRVHLYFSKCKPPLWSSGRMNTFQYTSEISLLCMNIIKKNTI